MTEDYRFFAQLRTRPKAMTAHEIDATAKIESNEIFFNISDIPDTLKFWQTAELSLLSIDFAYVNCSAMEGALKEGFHICDIGSPASLMPPGKLL